MKAARADAGGVSSQLLLPTQLFTARYTVMRCLDTGNDTQACIRSAMWREPMAHQGTRLSSSDQGTAKKVVCRTLSISRAPAPSKPRWVANCLISSLVPGSWPPNWLLWVAGKRRCRDVKACTQRRFGRQGSDIAGWGCGAGDTERDRQEFCLGCRQVASSGQSHRLRSCKLLRMLC